MELQLGISFTATMTVTNKDLALHQGSGDLPVLATPRMMALMEHAAMMAVKTQLDEGQTTVGAHIESSHLTPTPEGSTITATAILTAVEGRKLTFDIEAQDAQGNILGKGSHTRFIVDRNKFMSKIAQYSLCPNVSNNA